MVIAPLIISVLLVAMFILVEDRVSGRSGRCGDAEGRTTTLQKAKHPTMPVELWKLPGFAVILLTGFCFHAW